MTDTDTLGGIRPGFTANQVIVKLGPPGATSTPSRDRSLGVWLWRWQYFLPENNLAVELESRAKDGVYAVRAVIAKGDGIRTDRGIGVGCSPDDVRRAYPELEFEQIAHRHEDISVLRSGELLFRFSGSGAAPIVLGTPADYDDLEPATLPIPPRVVRPGSTRRS